MIVSQVYIGGKEVDTVIDISIGKKKLSRYSCVDIILRYIVIGACAIQFLHYAPLYRNTQHYATLNCRIKTRKCAGVT